MTSAAIDAHRDDPEFGYRLIAYEACDAGLSASDLRVWLLRSEQVVRSVFSKTKGLNRKAGLPVHDDLVERVFTARDVDNV